MSPDIVPAKTEVVAVVGIDIQPQQFALDTWASETALRILIIAIARPEEVVILAHVLVLHSVCHTTSEQNEIKFLSHDIHNNMYQNIGRHPRHTLLLSCLQFQPLPYGTQNVLHRPCLQD